MPSIKDNMASKINLFTKKQASLAKYINDNIYDVILMSATQIAEAACVSGATLTRFVHSLGYNSFADFHHELKKETLKRKNLAIQFRQISYKKDETPIYQKIFSLEQGLMNETMDLINPRTFDNCINLIGSAKSVILIGGPTQGHLIQYFADYLAIFRENVYVVNQLNMRTLGNITNLDERTVAFAIAYPRYPKETLNILNSVTRRGVKAIALTDSELSPIAILAEHVIITPMKYFLFVEPIASITSIIHSLLLGLYLRDEENIKERIKKYEEYILISDMFGYKDYNFADIL